MPALIQFAAAPPCGEIILNSPQKRNALSLDMWAEIPRLVAAAEADPDVKVLLIHGGPSNAFSAGADISEFETAYAKQESAKAAGATIAAALNAVETCTKPTIAAIEDACVGGGVSLAVACDLRVASETSRFGITPARLGLVYPAGDTRRLLQTIGASAAKDILFTGRIFAAEEARQMRLIDRMVATGEALHTARALATEISTSSQWSTRAIKTMIRGLQSGWQDDHAQAQNLFADGFSNEDFRDGYRAFLEKRPAKFTFE